MDKLGGKRSVGRGTWRAGLAMAALAAGLSWACGSAQAADVYWSVGVQSPGVVVGAANWAPPPVYAVPAPVVVYQQPRLQPPPPPVYQLGWAPPGPRHHHHHEHWRDDGDWREGPRFAPQGNWRPEGRGHGWR